tara:strand:- start:901 stop:1086 length:186 start_codon:yes stop_codon:yes gene_type:complete
MKHDYLYSSRTYAIDLFFKKNKNDTYVLDIKKVVNCFKKEIEHDKNYLETLINKNPLTKER